MGFFDTIVLVFGSIVGLFVTAKLAGNSLERTSFGGSCGYYTFRETLKYSLVGFLGVISLISFICGVLKLLWLTLVTIAQGVF